MTRTHVSSRLLAAATAMTTLLGASVASAYCRATPCDPANGTCKTDRHGCTTEGPQLFWPDGRVRLSVDGGGSVLRGISGDDTTLAVSEALGAWEAATCAGGEHPALEARVAQVGAGVTAEFNDVGDNESVVLFRDAAWPYGGTAVAKTTLGVNVETGEILDADIQLDSDKFDLTLDADAGGIDLVAVLTHEIGHVLGLGHSDVKGATMQPEATGFGTTELRSIEADDEKGICAIYPPGAAPVAPPVDSADSSGSSSGCSVARSRDPLPAAGSVLVALSLAALRRRARRRAVTGPRPARG